MSSPTQPASTSRPTQADLELLERLGPLVARSLTTALAPTLRRLMERLAEAEAQITSLRRELSTRPAADAGARSYTSLGEDPARPGYSLVVLDDGHVSSLPDERLGGRGRA
jgi:hypothetical protein